MVPALIAHDMGRQGIKRTTKAVLLAGVIVSLPIAVALVLQLKGVNDLAPLAGFGTMSIDNRWIPLAVLLSAAASWGVAHNYNLKAGGFVGAAYVGMFMGDPYQVAVAFAIAFVTFVLVRYVLMNVLILFGRRKFSAMLLTSSMISWTLLWVGPSFFSARVTNHLDLASMALTPLFVPGLLANDMDRTSPLRVVLGAGLAASFVVPTTWWIQSLVEGETLELPWLMLAAPPSSSSSGSRSASCTATTARRRSPTNSTSTSRLPSPTTTSRSGRCWRSSNFPTSSNFPRWPQSCSRLRRRRSSSGEPLFDIHSLERLDQLTWPQVERRKAGRPWADRPAAQVPSTAPDDISELTWQQLVPNVVSIDSAAWSPRGNRRWQDAHPDAWDDADRWLVEALTPDEFDSQVA